MQRDLNKLIYIGTFKFSNYKDQRFVLNYNSRFRVQLFKYVCKTATQVLKQQFLKAYPPAPYLYFKKTPPFFH